MTKGNRDVTPGLPDHVFSPVTPALCRVAIQTHLRGTNAIRRRRRLRMLERIGAAATLVALLVAAVLL